MRTFIVTFGILLLFTMSLSAKKIKIEIIIDDSVVYDYCEIRHYRELNWKYHIEYYSAYGVDEYGDEEISKSLRRDTYKYSKPQAKRLVAASIKALVNKGVCKKFRQAGNKKNLSPEEIYFEE